MAKPHNKCWHEILLLCNQRELCIQNKLLQQKQQERWTDSSRKSCEYNSSFTRGMLKRRRKKAARREAKMRKQQTKKEKEKRKRERERERGISNVINFKVITLFGCSCQHPLGHDGHHLIFFKFIENLMEHLVKNVDFSIFMRVRRIKELTPFRKTNNIVFSMHKKNRKFSRWSHIGKIINSCEEFRG
mmetsp:Transcript_30825/g.47999  ORF Transcript_30825/g.47999 Transcript_30825/m.47999 type:complete len:188 (-) Transcript_30825:978-1541(-)